LGAEYKASRSQPSQSWDLVIASTPVICTSVDEEK
jgi:hypothetical protein